MTPVEFRGDLWLQKTRVTGLSCGDICVTLRLAVLVEHRLVTGRQTDRHRAMAGTADAQHRAVKTEWWCARVVVCLDSGPSRLAYGPADATATHCHLLQ